MDPGTSIDVLWIRHCESCSNIKDPKTQAVEKYTLPPLCTSKGIRQSLEVAFRIGALAERLGVSVPEDVVFYCSYLPRAMMTATLAASALHAYHRGLKPSRRALVSVLCHIGELPNSYERARAERCVRRPSESTATSETTQCWIRDFNAELRRQGLAARLRGPRDDCAPRTPSCPAGQVPAWQWDGDDYTSVLANVLPHWFAEQAQSGRRKLRVIVSHGAYIKRSLFPTASPDEGRLPNTNIVFQRYTGVQDKAQQIYRFAHADPPVDYGNEAPARLLTPAAQDVVKALERRALRAWASDPCEWRQPLRWGACLGDSRAAAAAALGEARGRSELQEV
jgi:broad specificity phosphatase PhoE